MDIVLIFVRITYEIQFDFYTFLYYTYTIKRKENTSMKVNEMIKQLKKIRNEYGNVEVDILDDNNEYISYDFIEYNNIDYTIVIH